MISIVEMLLNLLHRFPNLGILAIVVCFVTGIVMAVPHVGRLILRIPHNEARDDAAFDAFKAIMSMVGVVLAFSLVEANNNLQRIETTVGREAAAINATDRILLRIGNPDLAVLRPALAAYGRSIVEAEWPRLAAGERSQQTDDAYNALSRQARAVSPADIRQQAMFSELLKSLDDMADLREEIIADGDSGLPLFFWITTGGLLTLGVGLAAMTSRNLTRTVGLGATAAAVSLLLSFVIIVDRPFEGETSVSPKTIVKALLANSRRV